MAAERFAVATILICITILLLSACGLPLGPATRARLEVVATSFVVYTPDHRSIATGFIYPGVDLQQLHGYILFPDCTRGMQIDLDGSLNPALELHSHRPDGPQIRIISATPPVYQGLAVLTLPFRGTMTRTQSCSDFSSVDIAAERLIGGP